MGLPVYDGTWNLCPFLPALPLYWGIVDVAKNTDVPIVPMCLEYRGKDCFVKYGEAIMVNQEDDKAAVINALRDIFATMKWEIWEGFPRECRKNIPENYWEREIERRLKEYKKLDYAYEMSCICVER